MAYQPPLNGGRINATISGNTAGVGALVSTGTLVLAGGNNITLSQTSNTINFSAPAAFSAGVASNSTVSNQVILTAGNNISLSQSTNATGATISVNATGLAGTGFTGTNATGTLNSNGLALSVGAGGGGGGVGIAGAGTTYTSGTVNFVTTGGGAITIGSSVNGASQSLNFSVPATSSLVGAGAVSLSTNGSTISISAPSPVTISRWENPTIQFVSMNTIPQGSLSVQNELIPLYVSATAAKIGGSLGLATSTGPVTGSISMSLWMGVYTMNGETLSLASSGSANNSFTFQGASSASSNYGTITGMRELTVPMNMNMSPGSYWVGAVLSTSTSGGLNGTYTIWGNTQMVTASTPLLAAIGASSASAYGFLPGQGIYKTTVGSMPVSIPLASINNTSTSNVMRANFYHAFYNTSFS